MEELKLDFVVKLGGSAITDKNQLEKLNTVKVAEAAILLNKCFESGNKFVVVHGAGSYGHHHAKQGRVNGGFKDLTGKSASDVRRGFCATRKSVLKLNALIVDSLISLGVPAVACSPCGMWQTENRVVKDHGVSVVKTVLSEGFVPVLHGDCVLDTQLGCCILSGDTIIQTLCKEIPVKKVVFLTDVAGIFSRPPDQEGAVLLPEIFVTKTGTLQSDILMSRSENDVTGGIELKLDTAKNIVQRSEGATHVFVCQIGSESAQNICLNNDFQNQTFTGSHISLVS